VARDGRLVLVCSGWEGGWIQGMVDGLCWCGVVFVRGWNRTGQCGYL
jgi:hypothetical protein